MAVLAIYATRHWMDDAAPERLAGVPTQVFEAREQQGDITHVYDDDRCPESPSKRSPFVFIRVTAADGSRIAASSLQNLAGPYVSTMLGESVVMRIARCRIDWDAFVRACGDDLDRDREIGEPAGDVVSFGHPATVSRDRRYSRTARATVRQECTIRGLRC